MLGGSGVSGDKEFAKLLATMTIARLNPQARKNTFREKVNFLINIYISKYCRISKAMPAQLSQYIKLHLINHVLILNAI